MNDYIKGLEPQAPKYYKNLAEQMAKDFVTDAKVENGVVRWKSNNNIPPKDILEFWNHIGLDFDIEKTLQTEKEETAKFFENYRKKHKKHSQEELFEMRAAFGTGTTVIDVISGRRTKL